MNGIELISEELFNKIRSQFSNLEIGDSSGKLTIDPRKARFFDFDFIVNGEKLGRVSISINDHGSLKLFYGSGILQGQSQFICNKWYNFLKDMRYFSKKRLLRYDTRDIERANLDKNDYRFLSSQSAVSESKMSGNKKISYYHLGETSLIIKHSKPIDLNINGARSRDILKIMIENKDGERFIFPYPYLSGARSMQRHILNGGNPYDSSGQSILNMCETISKLHKFKRKVGNNKNVTEESKKIMDAVNKKLNNLRETIKKLCNQKFYETWKNGFHEKTPELIIDEVSSQLYKEAFTRTNFTEELVEYFPLIHNIMKEHNTLNLEEYASNDDSIKTENISSKNFLIKELDQYTNWASGIEKFSEDVINELEKLIDSKIKVGVDGTSAIQSMRGVGINDRNLEKMIRDAEPNGDLNTIITIWLSSTGHDDIISRLNLNQSSRYNNIKEPEEELPEPEEELPEPEEELPEPDIDLKEDIIRLSGLK